MRRRESKPWALLLVLLLLPSAWALGDTSRAEARTRTRRPAAIPAKPGDYNGDGYPDLAIATYFEDLELLKDAGAVNVIYAGPNGIDASAGPGNQFWTQDSPGILDQAEANDNFGRMPSSADFNGDGYADLAVGVPRERLDNGTRGGAVNVIYGGVNGLDATNGPGNQFWTQDTAGMQGDGAQAGDVFGWPTVGGDFNGDGFGDLVIGVPGESVDGVPAAGAVNVIYGGLNGLDVNAGPGNQFWNQNSPGIAGDGVEFGDDFGRGFARGDLNGDGYDDLAIGVWQEDVGDVADAGAANVIYGGPDGLQVDAGPGNQFWSQGSPGMVGDGAQTGAYWARTSLTIGDFNGDGYGDFAAGALAYDVGNAKDAGEVNVIYGGPDGLGAEAGPGNQVWNQDSPGIRDKAEHGDFFGRHIAAGDFNGDLFDDLAIGVPSEDTGQNPSVGAVHVIYGGVNGLTAAGGPGSQFWTQDSAGILDQAEGGDEFGRVVATADFNLDGYMDLAAAAPSESLDSISIAGAVNVIYGGPNGLDASAGPGNQFWNQDSPDILDQAELRDFFGRWLVGSSGG